VLRESGPEALEATLRTESRAYWREKFHKRVLRDDQVTEELVGAGWKVLRYWESEVKADPERSVATIKSAVLARRTQANNQSDLLHR
jgi:G:T-mismatch repair DNA endonuclease (very short patch repair protein)